MSVDALGNPLRLLLTAGQRHEATQAKTLLLGFESERVMGDSAYDANAILADIDGIGAESVISPRSNRLEQRDIDRELYKERHLVECFISKIKRYRRVASTSSLATTLLSSISLPFSFGCDETSTQP